MLSWRSSEMLEVVVSEEYIMPYRLWTSLRVSMKKKNDLFKAKIDWKIQYKWLDKNFSKNAVDFSKWYCVMVCLGVLLHHFLQLFVVGSHHLIHLFLVLDEDKGWHRRNVVLLNERHKNSLWNNFHETYLLFAYRCSILIFVNVDLDKDHVVLLSRELLNF